MAALNHGVLFGAEPLARQPLFRVTDLNVGESQLLKLSDGSQANVKLLRIEETRDALRSALRLARVKVEVNGVIETIESGNYRLPMTVGGVQIDCPATRGLYPRHDLFEDSWGLDKDARLRLWPKGSPWIEPGSFGYPIKQRWVHRSARGPPPKRRNIPSSADSPICVVRRRRSLSANRLTAR